MGINPSLHILKPSPLSVVHTVKSSIFFDTSTHVSEHTREKRVSLHVVSTPARHVSSHHSDRAKLTLIDAFVYDYRLISCTYDVNPVRKDLRQESRVK